MEESRREETRHGTKVESKDGKAGERMQKFLVCRPSLSRLLG